jgi:hypothetical protein
VVHLEMPPDLQILDSELPPRGQMVPGGSRWGPAAVGRVVPSIRI